MSERERSGLNRRQAAAILGGMALWPSAHAAEPAFPVRAIRLILPFSAGSSTDFISRLVSDQLAKQLHQPVVVENRPGAAGIIGTQQLARATPDGYTIGLISLASVAMAPPTLKDLPYDSVRDFAPLSALVSTDMFLVAGPRAQGKDLAEFVTWARAQDKPLFLGTLGAGTSGHFAGFMFGQAAKIKFEPIHYRTFSDLMPAMLSGGIDVMLLAPSQILPFVKEGKMRALAMNGPARVPAFINVPTFLEAGYPTMQFVNWIGLAAPAKTPPEVLDVLAAEIIKATHVPGVRTKLEEGGFRVIASTRDELAATIRKDVPVWKNMVKTSGFTV